MPWHVLHPTSCTWYLCLNACVLDFSLATGKALHRRQLPPYTAKYRAQIHWLGKVSLDLLANMTFVDFLLTTCNTRATFRLWKTFLQAVWLGDFATEEEAARMYNRAAICVRGSAAMLNYPRENYKWWPVMAGLLVRTNCSLPWASSSRTKALYPAGRFYLHRFPVTVHRHYYCINTVISPYQGLLISLHHTESWKRPNLLCNSCLCHIDAPLAEHSPYKGLACYISCVAAPHFGISYYFHLCSSRDALSWGYSQLV